jgi:hypothetical protein
MYGCVLWSLDHPIIQDYCIAWRKGQRRVWNVPINTHNDLLPSLCNSLPVFDEICKRSLLFISSCVQHGSDLVKFVMRHGILFARTRSVLGNYVLFCSRRYSFNIEDVLNGNINSATFMNLFRNSRPASEITIRNALFCWNLLLLEIMCFIYLMTCL